MELFMTRTFHPFYLICCLLLSTCVHAVERIAPSLEKLSDRQKSLKGDAVILHKEKHYELDEQGNTTATVYRAIKINSRDAARDFSQISLNFNSHFDKLELDFARVKTADGSFKDLDKDAVQIQTTSKTDFYEDGRQLVFSLPAIEKGSIIEYQATFTSIRQKVPDELIGSSLFHSIKWITSEKGLRIDPVYESIIRVTIPESKILKFEINKQGIKHKKKQVAGKTVHQWTAKKISGIEIETSMPYLSELAPSIEFTTLKSWENIDNWASNLFKPTFDINNQISKVVKDISARNLNRSDTIFAVYEYLQQNIRYVFAHVDRGGYQPHLASEVLENRYGDCKDQTVLAVTLLRELGIEAYPGLISSENTREANPLIPTIPFDHMITYIPGSNGSEDIWLDTTGEQMLYPGFSPMIENRNALVIDGKGGQFLTTPRYKDATNKASVNVVFSPLKGKKPSGSITFKYSGGVENYIRSWWINSDDRKQEISKMVKGLYPALELTDLTASNPHDLKTSIEIKANFELKENWIAKESYSYTATPVQLIRLYTQFGTLLKPEDRHHPFLLHKAITLELNVLIEEPEEGLNPLLLNPGLNQSNSYFTLQQSGKQLDNNNYEINISLTLPETRVEINKYPKFYADMQRMLTDKPWLVVYQKNKQSAVSSVQTADTKDKGSAVSLTEIKRLLDEGNYEGALNSAQKYTQLNPEMAEGFYLLGLAQGYLDNFSESDRSFSKAKQLGYSF